MKQIISSLLIFLPCLLTWLIAIYQIYYAYTNRIKKQKFLKMRKTLGIMRWVTCLITIIISCFLGSYQTAFIIGIFMFIWASSDLLMLWVVKKR